MCMCVVSSNYIFVVLKVSSGNNAYVSYPKYHLAGYFKQKSHLLITHTYLTNEFATMNIDIVNSRIDAYVCVCMC